MTERGRRTLAEDRARRTGWLANAIATELTQAEQNVLIQAVPLLRRLSEL